MTCQPQMAIPLKQTDRLNHRWIRVREQAPGLDCVRLSGSRPGLTAKHSQLPRGGQSLWYPARDASRNCVGRFRGSAGVQAFTSHFRGSACCISCIRRLPHIPRRISVHPGWNYPRSPQRLAHGVRQGHLVGVRQGTRMRSGLTTMIAIALAREVATFSRCRS